MSQPKITDYGINRTETNSISDAELLAELHRLARVTGSRPTLSILKKRGQYSKNAYWNHFGSWSSALSKAGYEPTPTQDGNQISRESLLAEIKRLAEHLGRAPTSREMDSEGAFAAQTYSYRFGTWTEALHEAGVGQIGRNGRWIPIGELIGEMCRVADVVDRPPYKKDMRREGEFSARPFEERFGSWSEALRMCGFPPRYRGQTFHPPDEPAPESYGPSFNDKRKRALDRDGWQCQDCGLTNQEHDKRHGQSLHVHHILPLREFEDSEVANSLVNLITLCKDCHQKWEGHVPDINLDALVEELTSTKDHE